MEDYKKGYLVRVRNGVKEIHIDTHRATYLGYKWKSLGSWGRRKYENFIFLANNTGEPIIFFYKP